MPSFTIIDTVARRENKFPLGCEIVLDIAKKASWHADKTITDKGNAEKIYGLQRDYDIIGFSLYHQLQYLNIVPILKSFSIPFLTHDRRRGDPIVCAGGAAVTSNPFPIASFFDFILLGDAEACFPQIISMYSKQKDSFLKKLADTFPCVLVPRYPKDKYKVAVAKDLSSSILEPEKGRQPKIELARGCRFNCSFCLQSVIPYRENPLSSIIPVLRRYVPRGESGCTTAFKGRRFAKSVILSSNTPASYSEFLPLLDFCKQKNIYPRGFSERLSSLSLPVLEKMKELKMVQANIGIEGYSERLRKIIGKPISKEKLISKLTQVQRYIPILSLNFISHLPTVKLDDVLEVKETMEMVLSLRDKEGLNTGYDFTTTPLIARPHTPMELCPYVEEKAESLADSARISLLDQFTSVKMKFSMSTARRKMEFLLSRGDESFRDLFIKTYSKYPTYYFHQTFAEKILNCFADCLDLDYWLSSEVHPHWHRIIFS
jgi:radical SAM superfamily enzyme YgiQ (UPF0313 family)